MTDVADALRAARTAKVDSLDAQLLLAHVMQTERVWLTAHPEAGLTSNHWTAFQTLLQRRAAGEPLAYLVGEKEFYGLALRVDQRVLVPRPETELLVDWALELIAQSNSRLPFSIADLGTGSGAIALALKTHCPSASITAIDRCASALDLAQENAQRLQLNIDWLLSDWWQSLQGRRFNLIVSNPPYIAAGDAHLANLACEPQQALVAGERGLDDLATILAGAPQHLHRHGWIAVEHGHDQRDAVQQLMGDHGLINISTRLDFSRLPRCSAAQLP